MRGSIAKFSMLTLGTFGMLTAGAQYAQAGGANFSHCERVSGYNLACSNGTLAVTSTQVYDHFTYWDGHPSNPDSVYTRTHFLFKSSGPDGQGGSQETFSEDKSSRSGNSKSTTHIYGSHTDGLKEDGYAARVTNLACEDEYWSPDDCSGAAIHTENY